MAARTASRVLAHEQARGRATYAEVEESEADLHRFQAWLAKIEARDYFLAPGGDAARTAVAGRPPRWPRSRTPRWTPRPPAGPGCRTVAGPGCGRWTSRDRVVLARTC